MPRIILIGAGGHGQVVADILRSSIEPTYQILGFVDETEELWGQSSADLSILGGLDKLSQIDHDCVLVSIGDNHARYRLSSILEKSGEALVSAVHPSAILGSGVQIGKGCVICPNSVIGVGVQLGNGVIVNTAATIDHHSVVNMYAHIAPGTHTGGNVYIDTGSFIGIGSSIIPGVSVGAWAIVGAGSVVIEDVPSEATVVGVPAHCVKSKQGDS